MKENETHRCALVKEAFLGPKGYVGRVLCLLVGSPIQLQRLHQLRRAIEPEPVTKSACNELSKRRIAFEERLSIGLIVVIVIPKGELTSKKGLRQREKS